MPYTFPQKLREKLIEYFSRVHGETVNHDKADLYLASMADLYSAFSFGSRSPVASGETRFPKETYRSTRISRVRVKVEAPKAHDLDAPAREMQAPDVPLLLT